jgi:hypothetical protein
MFRRSFSLSISTSGWEIKMLFKISLASLDGPLLESAFGGGERVDAVVEGFPRASRVPFAPY